jgi:hypothetical protein
MRSDGYFLEFNPDSYQFELYFCPNTSDTARELLCRSANMNIIWRKRLEHAMSLGEAGMFV